MKTQRTLSIDVLLKEGDIEELREALIALSPFEIADVIVRKSEPNQSRIFGALPPDLAANTFDFLPISIQRHLVQTLPSMQAAYLLKYLSPDDRTAFLQELPQTTITELLKLLPEEERASTIALLGYPQNSIGRLMTTDYIAVKLNWTIEEVLEYIRRYGHDSETINDIYVIDEEQKLLDAIKIKEFLFVPKNFKVKDIVHNHLVALPASENDQVAINLFQKLRCSALPVTDRQGKLLGIVTSDDILRLSNQEATEDIQKIGGMQALSTPYLNTPFKELMKKRLGWLTVFFLAGSLSGSVLGYFKETILSSEILAYFLPLIISIGGSAGSQASALVLSALNLNEIKIGDWWKVGKREILSGIFLGSILGALGFLRIAFFHLFSDSYGVEWALIAETICLSILGVILWGTLVGAMLPLCLRRCGLDPAISSAPFVSSIISLTGLIIYFIVVSNFLKEAVK